MLKSIITKITTTKVEVVVDKEHYNDVKEYCERMAGYELDSTKYLEEYGVCYRMYFQFPTNETKLMKRLVKRLDGVIIVK